MAQELLKSVVEALIPIGATLLAGLFADLIRRFTALVAQRVSKEAADSLNETLSRLADDAVKFTEEVAHSQSRFYDKKLNAEDKKALAIEVLTKSAKEHNLTADRIEQLVLVAVLKMRSRSGFSEWA